MLNYIAESVKKTTTKPREQTTTKQPDYAHRTTRTSTRKTTDV